MDGVYLRLAIFEGIADFSIRVGLLDRAISAMDWQRDRQSEIAERSELAGLRGGKNRCAFALNSEN